MNKLIYETEDFKIIVAKEEKYVKIAADICSNEFSQCPFFNGFGAKKEDIYKITQLASEISRKENLFLVVVEKKENKVVTAMVALSNEGKHEFMNGLKDLELSFDLEMVMDFESKIQIPNIERPECVYLYMMASVSSYRNKSLGSCMINETLSYLKKQNYKCAYGETVNSKAEYIVKKNGATIYKSMPYQDYEYKNQKLKIVGKGDDKHTSFVFNLESRQDEKTSSGIISHSIMQQLLSKKNQILEHIQRLISLGYKNVIDYLNRGLNYWTQRKQMLTLPKYLEIQRHENLAKLDSTGWGEQREWNHGVMNFNGTVFMQMNKNPRSCLRLEAAKSYKALWKRGMSSLSTRSYFMYNRLNFANIQGDFISWMNKNGIGCILKKVIR